MPLCSTSWRKRSSARLHRLHKYHAGDLGNRTGQGVPRRVYRTLRTQVSWTVAGGRQFLPVSLLQETGSVSAGADRAAHHRERKRKRRGIGRPKGSKERGIRFLLSLINVIGGFFMSTKSQENNMRRLAVLLSHDLGYIWGEKECGPNGAKRRFHKDSV